MHPANGDWILVRGGDPDTIRTAVVSHSNLCRHEVPVVVQVSILRVDGARFALRFASKCPPYVFANLIGWLADPRMDAGAATAMGWFTSPGTGVRYCFWPRPPVGGDTLDGCDERGHAAAVYLPECDLSRDASRRVLLPAEPVLGASEVLAAFEIEVDANPDFGNPFLY